MYLYDVLRTGLDMYCIYIHIVMLKGITVNVIPDKRSLIETLRGRTWSKTAFIKMSY